MAFEPENTGEPGSPIPRVHRALCRPAAWTANVNIGCWSRGVGKPGFPTPPPGGRVWEGYALPGTIVCSSRRCAARAAWAADVTMNRPRASVGGRRPRTRAPPGGRVWEGLALTQRCGETGFPQILTRWESLEGLALRQGSGGTGFPHAPAPQGNGETGFPQTPIRGRVWESKALPGTTVGRPRSRVRGKRSHSLATIVGRGMKPRSFNLSRISSMDFCPRLRTESRAFSSICSTCPTRVISARFRQL